MNTLDVLLHDKEIAETENMARVVLLVGVVDPPVTMNILQAEDGFGLLGLPFENMDQSLKFTIAMEEDKTPIITKEIQLKELEQEHTHKFSFGPISFHVDFLDTIPADGNQDDDVTAEILKQLGTLEPVSATTAVECNVYEPSSPKDEPQITTEEPVENSSRAETIPNSVITTGSTPTNDAPDKIVAPDSDTAHDVAPEQVVQQETYPEPLGNKMEPAVGTNVTESQFVTATISPSVPSIPDIPAAPAVPTVSNVPPTIPDVPMIPDVPAAQPQAVPQPQPINTQQMQSQMYPQMGSYYPNQPNIYPNMGIQPNMGVPAYGMQQTSYMPQYGYGQPTYQYKGYFGAPTYPSVGMGAQPPQVQPNYNPGYPYPTQGQPVNYAPQYQNTMLYGGAPMPGYYNARY